MRIRGDSRTTVDLPSPSTEPIKGGAFARLGKKASVQALGSSPAATTPVIAAPTSNLGTLETLPVPLLLKVLHVCAPELSNVRNISQGYRELVERYIARKTKRFQESIEEAECWGHKAPSLPDVIHLDPLTLENILTVHYSARLAPPSGGPEGDSVADASERGPVSVMDEEEDHLPETEDENYPRKRRPPPARLIRRDHMRSIMYGAMREALDRYEQGCWPTINVLRDFVIHHGLHYPNATGSSLELDLMLNLQPPIVPDDQSERDVADGDRMSLRSVRVGPKITFMPTSPSQSQSHASADALNTSPFSSQPSALLIKDLQWLRINSELYRLATLHGHPFNLPPLSDLDNPLQTLSQAADLAIRSGRPDTLVACLDASRLYGCLWSTIDKALQAALSAHRINRAVPMDVMVVLLDATFNDPSGPWTFCVSQRSWGGDGWITRTEPSSTPLTEYQQQERLKSTARDLLLKAEECTKVYGIPWHRLSVKGEFAVVPVQEVAREVRSRVRIMT
ncbi:hypothetical protein DFS34DRAFT_636451 [Phlyctochytrium arcticum]|nr:hypothetical protein DFS34DRAFT_636451 [Phlyctochytrium arcticum]